MSVSAKPASRSMWPVTRWGWATVGLFAGFVLSSAFFQLAVATGQKGGDTIFDNLWLSIPGLAGTVFALLATAAGGVAVFVRRERTTLVSLVFAIGLIVTIFTLAEVGVPLLVGAPAG